nr:Retrovirus-related Pol polyprotein from transposon TNT 1-94 [Ipomoea batatas]
MASTSLPQPIAAENPIPTSAAPMNTTNTRSPVDFDPSDNKSPYYLHANESPTLQLVSSLLDSSNYHEWARAMKVASSSKNKFGFINGLIKMPSIDDPKFFFWELCNNMVVSWLVRSLSPTIGRSVLWIDTAEGVWADLKKRFNKQDVFRIVEIQAKIYQTKQGSRNVNEYFTQLKLLWDEFLVLRPAPTCICDQKCKCSDSFLAKAMTNFENDMKGNSPLELTVLLVNFLTQETLYQEDNNDLSRRHYPNSKDEVKQLVQGFCALIHTQFGKVVKCIRTDNGREFYMPKYYLQKGILHQTTCVYTPQQNSVVERKHGHILSVARALKFPAKLPDCFWGDCILHAVYIINRLPSASLDNKIPYQLLFNKLPQYQHLKVIGCLAYAAVHDGHRTKFSPKARRCVFIGYTDGTKGYKLYDTQTKDVIVSRDVVFYEDIFPFQISEDPANIQYQLILPTEHATGVGS